MFRIISNNLTLILGITISCCMSGFLFFGMSFALWGPQSDKTIAIVFMLTAFVLAGISALHSCSKES